MLHELVFDVDLDTVAADRDIREFTLAHPDFRRHSRDIRFTQRHAWILTVLEGKEASLRAYECRYERGPTHLVLESFLVGSGPGLRMRYEKHRVPREGEEETVWHLASSIVGLDARVEYETSNGRSRVTVMHEDKGSVQRFFRRVEETWPGGTVRFVRFGPVEGPRWRSMPADDAVLLRAAWEAGYYENPRRTTLRALASALGVSFSMVGYRLRQIEANAVERMLAEAETLPSTYEAARGRAEGDAAVNGARGAARARRGNKPPPRFSV